MDEGPDILDLFADPSYRPSATPMPWYPGAKMDLDDYGRCLLHILPVGRGNAMDATVIARKLNLPWERTEYPLRHLIRRLTLERGWPIGSVSGTGNTAFYLIDNDADADHYTTNLENRAKAILERRTAIIQGWEKRKRLRAQGRTWPL